MVLNASSLLAADAGNMEYWCDLSQGILLSQGGCALFNFVTKVAAVTVLHCQINVLGILICVVKTGECLLQIISISSSHVWPP